MAVDDRWWGLRARLHVTPWHSTLDTVVISPLPHRPSPSCTDVLHEMHTQQERGIKRVLTTALHQGELGPFLDAGFTIHEHLHLLNHDLSSIPEATCTVRHRRAWRRDYPELLAVDAKAFEPFWALDQSGLVDAIRATPSNRVRVSTLDNTIIAYAVSGRSGGRGYLQRLAVDPLHHRGGIGRSLVVDSLKWLRRNGAGGVAVNTQEKNSAALDLYLSTGFKAEPSGLSVLTMDLDDLT